MSLMVMVHDGPCEGSCFTVSRCPKHVACVVAADGKTDILNEPEDRPELGETMHWYRWDGQPAGHVCVRGKGRGCYSTIGLVHAPEEPK